MKILSLIIFGVILAFAGPGLAHEWFDSWCCSGEDCKKTAVKSYRLTRDGGALVRHRGKTYTVPATITMQDGSVLRRVQPSKDGFAYACIMGADGPSPDVRCLYHAPTGF